jgi:hypothetical protein
MCSCTPVFTHITPEEGKSFELEITVTFEAEDGKTRLRLREEGYPDAETRDASCAMERARLRVLRADTSDPPNWTEGR